MKAMIILWLVSEFAALGQPVPQQDLTDIARPTTPPKTDVRTGTSTSPTVALPDKPKASGALVQAARLKNPLQLINPFAPMELGNGFDNVSRDPNSGKAQGIKLFSIKF